MPEEEGGSGADIVISEPCGPIKIEISGSGKKQTLIIDHETGRVTDKVVTDTRSFGQRAIDLVKERLGVRQVAPPIKQK